MDYIDRDAVLEAVLNLPPKMDEQGYGWLGRRGVWQMLCDFPSSDVVPVVHGEWIPMVERLPTEKGWYLIYVSSEARNQPNVRTAYFYPAKIVYGNKPLWEVTTSKKSVSHDPMDGFITHWMPLPEPPKDGET